MKNEMKNKKNKRRRVLLVAPRHPENFWNLEGMLPIFGAKTLMPNAALATLKALTPAELTIEYILCDENISPIDFNTSCDLAAVTGYTLHAERVRELCKAFRQKGIPVALGGAYATIEADKCKGLADYHFIGEAEYTWPQFLKEWERGEPKPEYEQKAYIDMKDSPGPDWSLVDPGDYVHYSIQTSRGCPNKCDFCDVIQYQGRKYRTKRTDQVLQEIKDVHAQGVPAVFFSDDNFTGNKKYTRELLAKIIEWNRAQAQPLLFTTQATVEVADDEELLRMFADANFTGFFLGVETTRKESLEEVHKTHNIRHDIYERMSRLSRYGLIPLVGLIVGFDHDDETVFDELYGFIDRANAPTVGISLLNAPPNTPLYERLQKEGRLEQEDFSGEWQLYSNIIPKNMSKEILVKRYRELFKKLYEPEAFQKRFEQWMRSVEYFSENYAKPKITVKQLILAARMFGYYIFRANRNVRKLFFRSLKLAKDLNPQLINHVFAIIAQYAHYYEFTQNLEKKKSN